MKFEKGFKFMDKIRDYEVIEYIEKFGMYRIKNFTDNKENQLMKEAEIQKYVDTKEEIKLKREKSKTILEKEAMKDEAERIQLEKEKKEAELDFGYTENMTAMQKGKVLKTLNKNVLYNNELISRKRLIEKILKEYEDVELKIVHNTNRITSKRIQLEYKKLKDKTEYRIYFNKSYNNRIFLELTITEYKFVEYLINNNIIKKAS